MKTIIAPSAAGKTHWIKSHQWCKDIDLDPRVAEVYSRCRKYWGDKWWQGENAGQQLLAKDSMMRGLAKYFARMSGWYATAELVFADAQSIFVIPSPNVLTRQSLARYAKGVLNHPVFTEVQAAEQVSLYRKYAMRSHSLVFESFDALKCDIVTRSGGT